MKPKLVALAAAVLVAIAAYAWVRGDEPGAAAAAAPAAPDVLVAAAVSREHVAHSSYTGSLSATNAVELKPRVSGFIQAVNVPEGQLVRQGQPLFMIDPSAYRARLDAARAATRVAQARLGLAIAENTRAKRLVKEGVVAQERSDQASAALAERQAEVAAARAAEQLAAIEMGHTTVRAPISGRVGSVEVTRGNLVTGGASATALTTIVSVDPLYVDFSVDERTYLNALARTRSSGPAAPLTVKVRLEDGSVRDARLDFVGNRLDRGTGTVQARAVLPNRDGELAPGLFAQVELPVKAPAAAVLISDLAIGVEQGQRFVLVLDKQNVVQHRPVTLGATVDGLRVVETGLRAGERVILKGMAGPGMTVKPRVVPMESQVAQVASAKGTQP